jgi:hypothetical protein
MIAANNYFNSFLITRQSQEILYTSAEQEALKESEEQALKDPNKYGVQETPPSNLSLPSRIKSLISRIIFRSDFEKEKEKEDAIVLKKFHEMHSEKTLTIAKDKYNIFLSERKRFFFETVVVSTIFISGLIFFPTSVFSLALLPSLSLLTKTILIVNLSDILLKYLANIKNYHEHDHKIGLNSTFLWDLFYLLESVCALSIFSVTTFNYKNII